ncbi:Protein translocase subunit SecY [Candidatus Portiera aleyrodidarum]|uniref:Protein translocase subunit SecY n=1 Tax=Candidatus Portiera aleyrodidarum TV TaxID=1297582 RepID=A0A8D3X7D6_9GAMM|nr:preprotein translocase subunit SecY [Candidatus Portiera aleyrodidarum]AGI27109.1 protein translocase subunit secY/sec61 alpha [Candidatus Portiera aleyrodidarum TV]CEI59077.1 Protein translocase subunit SecY [Candidatus Portiera aleyrodidarum]
MINRKNISNIYKELMNKIRFSLVSIIIYRIGAHIPVPGINTYQLSIENSANIISLFNMFSGGALERMSIFSLGLMPYISASIIIQLMTVMFQKDGEVGRNKITKYIRYSTVILAVIQSIGIAIGLLGSNIVYYKGVYLTIILTFVTGAIFLMWLGEQITEKGIGNGISLIILSGLVAGIPKALGKTLELTKKDSSWNIITIFFLLILVIITIAIVVFIESGQRRIKVNYPRRQIGNKMYASQSSYLPIKVNMAGVIPPIFASSILLFTASVGQWINKSIIQALSPGQPLYIILFVLYVIFFSFFYTSIVFNSKEVSIKLKKSGAFIQGIRPGEKTAIYIDKVTKRLNLFGAIYITFFSLIPQFIMVYCNIPFGGTSILIMVVVVMDFISQIQSYLMSNKYERAMKKYRKKI